MRPARHRILWITCVAKSNLTIAELPGQPVESLQSTVSRLLCMQGVNMQTSKPTWRAARTDTVPLADGLWD